MPQVIAAERGASSSTADGTSILTLFTLSTGIATRVILNSVSFVSTGSGGTNPTMSLVINNNTTGNRTPVALLGGSSGASARGSTMFPGQSTFASVASNSNRANILSEGVIITASNNVIGTDLSFTATNIGQLALGTDNNRSDASFKVVPSQFWMNSGDRLEFRCFLSGAPSVSVIWNFTTITET